MNYLWNYSNQAYPTMTLADIFGRYADLYNFYMNAGLPNNFLEDDKYNLETAYFLIMSEYASSPIKSDSTQLFKLRFARLIFENLPVWQREMYLRDKLLNMSDEELMSGAKTIHNRADHPGSMPSTASLTELQYINQQTTSNYVKNAPEAIRESLTIIQYNPTEAFLEKFKGLFVDVMYSENVHYFEEEVKA